MFFKIIDDSGVDYNFLSAFCIPSTSWKGQIVKGFRAPTLYAGAVIVEKPYGISGVWITDEKNLEEVPEMQEKNELF